MISVVTVNLNNALGLRQTLDSIRYQKAKGALIQSIVIDGSSKDNSLMVAKDFSDIIDVLISESDEGIYAAMNKGLNIATGDSVIFINSGDAFYENFDLKQFQLKYPLSQATVLCRTIQYYQDDGYIRPSLKDSNPTPISFGHQGFFVPKAICDLNPYRLDMPISADSEWKSRVLQNCSYILTSEICAIFPLGGISNDPNLRQLGLLLRQPSGLIPASKAFLKLLVKSVLGIRLTYRLIFCLKYDMVSIKAQKKLEARD